MYVGTQVAKSPELAIEDDKIYLDIKHSEQSRMFNILYAVTVMILSAVLLRTAVKTKPLHVYE